MEFKIYQLALYLGGAAALAAAYWIWRLRPESLPKIESLPRNRQLGFALALPALIWCIPHARPIVFDWMLPLLWPMAVGGAVLAYFYLDYLFSRAVGGMLILLAYYYVHSAFEYHTVWLPALSVLCHLAGILGIAFSGKPCWMRDLLRAFCRSGRYRALYGVYFVLLGAVLLAGAVLGRGGVQ